MNEFTAKALDRAIDYNRALIFGKIKEAEDHERVARILRESIVGIEKDLRGFEAARNQV